MILAAFFIGLIAVTVSVLGARATFQRLHLNLDDLLLFFGLAELPTPQTSRRDRYR